MRIPRFPCALTLSATFLCAVAPTSAHANNNSFRSGLRSAIGEVANLIETGVEQNRPAREIRELDRALRELVQAFASRRHHHHHHGHHSGGMNVHHHGPHVNVHHHSGHFTSGFQMTKNQRSSSESAASSDVKSPKPTDKKSSGSVRAKATMEPSAKQPSGKPKSGANDSGTAGQSRIANGTRILANPFERADGGKKSANKASTGKNTNAKNIGERAGKKGTKHETQVGKQMPAKESPMRAAGKNVHNNQGKPGTLVGANAQACKQQPKSATKGTTASNIERAVGTKNGPGGQVGRKSGGSQDMGRNNRITAKVNAASCPATGKNGVGSLVGANTNKKVNNAGNAKSGGPRQGNPPAGRGEQTKMQTKNPGGNQASAKTASKTNNPHFTSARNGPANQMSRPNGNIRNGACAAGQARTATTGRRK